MLAMQSHTAVNHVLATHPPICEAWPLFLIAFCFVGFKVLQSKKPLDGKRKTVEIRSDRLEVGDDVQIFHNSENDGFSTQFGRVVRNLRGTDRGRIRVHVGRSEEGRDIGESFYEVELDES